MAFYKWLPSAREEAKATTYLPFFNSIYFKMKTFVLTLFMFCLSCFTGLMADNNTSTAANDSQDQVTQQDFAPMAMVFFDEANEDLQPNMIASASKHLPQYSIEWITSHFSAFIYWNDGLGKLHGKLTFIGDLGEPITVEAVGDNDCRLIFICLDDIL